MSTGLTSLSLARVKSKAPSTSGVGTLSWGSKPKEVSRIVPLLIWA